MSDPPMANAVGASRRRRGWSQARLARAAGLSRQALSAIEAGRAVPSTAVALRLAEALSVRVDALFWLEADAEVPVHVVGGSRAGRARIGRVGGRWVAHPMPPTPLHATADAELSAGGRARLLDDPERLGQRLLVAGCDPAIGLLAALAARAGVELTWIEATSRGALETVARGEAHVAGAHLFDEASGEHNVPFVRAAWPGRAALVVELASTEEGLVTRPGAAIRSVADLADGPRIVNRPEGAGARALLDRELARAGVPAGRVRGYDEERPGHEAVARAVARGDADAGVATHAVALAHGLSFVPLHGERFDLALPVELLDFDPARRLLSVLDGRPLRRQLAAVGGYDTAGTGREVART
ncbi:MAG TPA: substrate-binding domain-containing protein [Sandaracinaceae bacterium LLY-WYZ-13_1]|nr:substrate-binding domain-containing protein [Sandaracinaceae bacterium LLY-WYZ-13_1]